MSQRRARKNLQVAYTTRQESSDKTQMWDINDPRAHKIHTRIGEMIALDYQPFSIVDNVGFFVHWSQSMLYQVEDILQKLSCLQFMISII